jgi:shikimate dehydrogenase
VRALVLGNGGAARAAVVACRDLGARQVFVSSRKWRGEESAWERAEGFAELRATPLAWGDPAPGHSDVAAVAPSCLLVVQATSAGMHGVGGGEELSRVLPWRELDRRSFLYDVVYNPTETPFLRDAKAAGLGHEGGLSMLVGQAALAFELWLAQRPARERMQRAAEEAIFGARQ